MRELPPAEVGTGIKTAIAQLAADELDVALDRIILITADTGLNPDEGVTAGSRTLEQSGIAVADAAANVRLLLAEAAVRRLGMEAIELFTRDGAVLDDRGRCTTYAELAAATSLAVRARTDVPRKRPEARRLIGRAVPRVDLPAKLTSLAAYVHDMHLPGMVHARVLRGRVRAPAHASTMTGSRGRPASSASSAAATSPRSSDRVSDRWSGRSMLPRAPAGSRSPAARRFPSCRTGCLRYAAKAIGVRQVRGIPDVDPAQCLLVGATGFEPATPTPPV